jgi:LTXXQ motif family protein
MRFRTFVFLMVFAGAATSTFGQGADPKRDEFVFFSHAGAMHFANDRAGEDVIKAVRSALNLSDAQVNALQALVTMREQTTEQVMQSVHETHKKLEDATNQANPNPADVGAALLASRGAEERLRAADEKFKLDFNALLNANQRSTLEKLKAAAEQIHSLETLGVFDAGFHHEFTQPILAAPGFAIDIERHRSNQD